jgi:hypothetical protein
MKGPQFSRDHRKGCACGTDSMSFCSTTDGGRATSGELQKDLGRQWIDCTMEWRCRVAFVLILIEQEKYPDCAKTLVSKLPFIGLKLQFLHTLKVLNLAL